MEGDDFEDNTYKGFEGGGGGIEDVFIMTKKFEGFDPEPKTWDFPMIINGWVHQLTGSEFKVLWYILRHTHGWQKDRDTISYKQFRYGIRKKDGDWFDKGTGLGEGALKRALKGLVDKGFIERNQEKDKKTGKWTITEYKPKYRYPPTDGRPSDNRPTTIPNSIQSLANNNNSSKEELGQKPYGNSSINEILSYLKAKAGWIDGSQKQQRYGCRTFMSRVGKLIKEMGGGEPTDRQIIDGCKKIIDLAAADKFHSKNFGRIKYIYDNIGGIVRASANKGKKIIGL